MILSGNCIYYCYILILRHVVELDEFLSISSEQMIKLIASEELIVLSEAKVGKIKLIIFIFYYPSGVKNLSNLLTHKYRPIYS